MIKKILTYTYTAFLSLVLITACTDNPSKVDENPPQLPPESSMKMDFSEFNSQNPKAADGIASADNFGRAVATAVIMKAVVDFNLAIPRALLAAAANSKAELQDDGEWVWKYSKSTPDASYEVRLVATRSGDDSVNWNFYVTNTDVGLDNQLFFKGSTNGDGSEGSWTYYSLNAAQANEEVSTISWTISGENNVHLKLEVVSDRNSHQGDYIDYTSEGAVKHAAYYNAANDETTELQINTQTKVGFIIAPDYNGGQKACWDSNYQDASCSGI